MGLSFKTNISKWLNNLQPLKPQSTDFCPNLKTGKKAKAIIFDIYGTLLISSSGDIEEASLSVKNMKEALVAGGFKVSNSSFPEFLLSQLPVKIASNQQEIKKKGHPHPDVDIFKVWGEMISEAEKKGQYKKNGQESLTDTIMIFELLSNPVFPMPGMKDIIDELTARNIPIGIVSNAQFYTPIIMNWFLTNKFSTQQDIEFFDPELSVFSYKELRAKPDTALFGPIKKTLKFKYQIEPNDALFVGNDMLKDVLTAKKSGFRTVLFAGDKRSLRLRENDDRVKKLFPDFIINNLKQISEII